MLFDISVILIDEVLLVALNSTNSGVGVRNGSEDRGIHVTGNYRRKKRGQTTGFLTAGRLP